MSHVVKNTLQYIEKESHSNFSIKQVATHFDITHEYLSRVFHKECKIQLKEYIKRFKIEKSKECLARKPYLSIKDVAAAAGINNENHFSRLFKQYTNLTPTQFRKNLLSS